MVGVQGLITTASRCRTPERARAARILAEPGPASTRTAREPSLTSSASPWPTSSIVMRAPGATGGPTATATSTAPSAPSTPRARRRVGVGHATHRSAPSAAHTHAAGAADMPIGTAANGHDAMTRATATAADAGSAATSSTSNPPRSQSAETPKPARPTTNASDTNGPATTFAAGDTSETIPNVLTVMGRVAAVAVNVSATEDASHRPRPPAAETTHVSANRANSTRPATAATES
jgi:hypothetical protein